MKLTLGTNWRIILDNHHAYIERRQDQVRIAALSAHEAVSLALMNGERSVEQVEKILVSIAGQHGILTLQSILSRLKPLLVEEKGTPVDIPLDLLAQVYPPDPAAGLRQLPGPRVLHWWVTHICPRRCIYCYVHPQFGGRATDAILSREKLHKIFEEAASLGATDLLIAGAEPFLREDLPEIIGDAIATGITPHITTKYVINNSLAERLASNGMRHICLSVDTFVKEENYQMIGSGSYGNQVLTSVKNLQNSGIAFSFECVVTPFNRTSLSGVAREAERHGARVLQIVPFEPVQKPIGPFSNDEMLIKDIEVLDSEIECLKLKYPTLKIERFEELGSGLRKGFHCDIGQTKLFFTQEGYVHRCYKLTHDKNLRGVDLREKSVAEAWHDPQFRKIISPPREKYAGSACSNCNRFDACHEDGRCIYQAWIDQGSYYSKDRSCSGPFND